MPNYQREEQEDEIVIDQDIIVPATTSTEEKTFAQRYADLRRHLAKKETEWRESIQNLTAQVQSRDMPNSEDETAIEEWVAAHPKIAKIVMGLADRRAAKASETISEQLADIRLREKNLEKETAERKLSERHPDFFTDIRNDPAFHEWLDGKSKVMQDALYADDYDWRTAADVVTLYKTENGIGTTQKKEPKTTNNREAAADVTPRAQARPKDNGGSYLFSESEIQKMKDSEYEAREEEITKAMREGRVLMDLSGGAR
jgi:hypothetical protein